MGLGSSIAVTVTVASSPGTSVCHLHSCRKAKKNKQTNKQKNTTKKKPSLRDNHRKHLAVVSILNILQNSIFKFVYFYTQLICFFNI